MVVPYKHETFTDFDIPENRQEFEAALKQVELELGQEYPLIINGERVTTEATIVSVNPASKDEVVGTVSKADKESAEQAMQAAHENFSGWRKSHPAFRADILFRAAAIVRRRKHEFSAWIVKEGGKPWVQADADIAEGIDFMEYYARHMLALKDGSHV